MIFIEIKGHALLLENIIGLNVSTGKVFLLDGNILTFDTETVARLKETLKKMNGVTWQKI